MDSYTEQSPARNSSGASQLEAPVSLGDTGEGAQDERELSSKLGQKPNLPPCTPGTSEKRQDNKARDQSDTDVHPTKSGVKDNSPAHEPDLSASEFLFNTAKIRFADNDLEVTSVKMQLVAIILLQVILFLVIWPHLGAIFSIIGNCAAICGSIAIFNVGSSQRHKFLLASYVICFVLGWDSLRLGLRIWSPTTYPGQSLSDFAFCIPQLIILLQRLPFSESSFLLGLHLVLDGLLSGAVATQEPEVSWLFTSLRMAAHALFTAICLCHAFTFEVNLRGFSQAEKELQELRGSYKQWVNIVKSILADTSSCVLKSDATLALTVTESNSAADNFFGTDMTGRPLLGHTSTAVESCRIVDYVRELLGQQKKSMKNPTLAPRLELCMFAQASQEVQVEIVAVYMPEAVGYEAGFLIGLRQLFVRGRNVPMNAQQNYRNEQPQISQAVQPLAEPFVTDVVSKKGGQENLFSQLQPSSAPLYDHVDQMTVPVMTPEASASTNVPEPQPESMPGTNPDMLLTNGRQVAAEHVDADEPLHPTLWSNHSPQEKAPAEDTSANKKPLPTIWQEEEYYHVDTYVAQEADINLPSQQNVSISSDEQAQQELLELHAKDLLSFLGHDNQGVNEDTPSNEHSPDFSNKDGLPLNTAPCFAESSDHPSPASGHDDLAPYRAESVVHSVAQSKAQSDSCIPLGFGSTPTPSAINYSNAMQNELDASNDPTNQQEAQECHSNRSDGSTEVCHQNRMQDQYDKIPRAPDGTLTSFGSIGHPNCCKEACKYHGTSRGCKEGVFCPRCHLCRWRKKRRHGSDKVPAQQTDSNTQEPQPYHNFMNPHREDGCMPMMFPVAPTGFASGLPQQPAPGLNLPLYPDLAVRTAGHSPLWMDEWAQSFLEGEPMTVPKPPNPASSNAAMKVQSSPSCDPLTVELRPVAQAKEPESSPQISLMQHLPPPTIPQVSQQSPMAPASLVQDTPEFRALLGRVRERRTFLDVDEGSSVNSYPVHGVHRRKAKSEIGSRGLSMVDP